MSNKYIIMECKWIKRARLKKGYMGIFNESKRTNTNIMFTRNETSTRTGGKKL